MPTMKFSIIDQNNDIVREDVRSISPAESFVVNTVAPPVMIFDQAIEEQQNSPPPEPGDWDWYDIKGDFLFHCHIEHHMIDGLAGLIRVKRRIWLYDTQLAAINQATGLPVYDPRAPQSCPDPEFRCNILENGVWRWVKGSDEANSLPGITMMHAVLIPKTSKILFWGYVDQDPQSRILDVSNIVTPYSTPSPQPWELMPGNITDSQKRLLSDIWSAEHTFLNTDEGTILIHGGFTGKYSPPGHPYYGRLTFLFHSESDPQWEFLGGNDLNNLQNLTQDGRYYSTTLTMADGRALTLFGRQQLNSGEYSLSMEIFNLNSMTLNKWEQFIAFPDENWPYKYYPWAFLLPDGKIFISGPQKETRLFDINSPGSFAQYPGTIADRDIDLLNQEGTSVLLPLRTGNNYASKVIIAGGETQQVWKSAQIIDLSSDTPGWSSLTDLTYPRKTQTNSVILSDGKILICGGAFDKETGINQVPGRSEVFDPETNTWSLAAENLNIRGYHSAALLLPDGTVVLGGDPAGNRLGAEIKCERYFPPYWFKERPVIKENNFPADVNYDTDFTIEIEGNTDSIIEPALIYPGAVTHGFNMTQRYVECTIVSRNPLLGTITLHSPLNGNVAPPAWYFLVIIKGAECYNDNCDKIPSVGKWIRLKL